MLLLLILATIWLDAKIWPGSLLLWPPYFILVAKVSKIQGHQFGGQHLAWLVQTKHTINPQPLLSFLPG